MKKKNNNTSRFQSKQISINAGLNDDYKKVISFFVVLAIIALAILLLYYLNGTYVTKDMKKDDNTTTTTVAFDKSVILAKDTFNQGKGEYMVMFYDKTDNVQSVLYNTLVGQYDNEKIELYSVDLGSALNKKYYDKDGEENTKPVSAKDLKFNKPTLITVKKGKVASYLSDKDKIVDKLSK